MLAGTIDSLWRFPVKSFMGEKLDVAEFEKNGIIGDRAYALIDKETRKVVTAKNIRRFPDLLMCSALYVNEPQVGKELPPLKITLGNGIVVRSDAKDINQILSEFFSREVVLDCVEPKPESHLFRERENEFALAPKSFMDAFPISIITTSTLTRLQELHPESNFDPRRFRMNIVIKAIEKGFAENLWVGKMLTIGKNLRISVTIPDSRCVMTTLAQKGIVKDSQILKTLTEHNSLYFNDEGNLPCTGVYGNILNNGTLRVNDIIELT